MAMPSGDEAVTDRMQFVKGMGAGAGGGGGGGGGAVQARPRVVDERDGIIAWLRSEFAAANAIIDLMSDHLRAVSERGEYEYVIGAIQQRRCNWSPVLRMQPYFPIGEVSDALQHVMHRKQQQRRYLDCSRRLSDMGYRQSHDGGSSTEFRAYEDEGEDKVETFDEGSSIPTVEKRGTLYLLAQNFPFRLSLLLGNASFLAIAGD